MELLLPVLFIGLLLAMYLVGVPVGYALGLTVVVMMLAGFIPYQPRAVAQLVVRGINSFVLLAIPLFLLTGKYMNMFELTDVIFDFARAIVGPIRGGLAHVNVIASIIFSGMTGSAAADAAGLGTIEYKAMRDANYQQGFSVAVTGSSSIIGPIIPPSIPLIIYGIIAQTSIGALFIGGILPGFLMAVGLLAISSYYAHQHGYERGDWWSARNILATLIRAAPALGTPVLIIGGLMSGLFTATEAGAVALVYTLLVGSIFYERPALDDFLSESYDGFVTTAALTFIIAMANLYGFMIRRAQIPDMLADATLAVTTSDVGFLLIVTVVFLLIGLFMEAIAAITILVPIFLPVATELGVDPIHFGIIVVITLMIGLLTPPFGMILFVLESVTDVQLERIVKSMLPFYVPLVGVLVMLIVWPDLALWLPRSAGLI